MGSEMFFGTCFMAVFWLTIFLTISAYYPEEEENTNCRFSRQHLQGIESCMEAAKLCEKDHPRCALQTQQCVADSQWAKNARMCAHCKKCELYYGYCLYDSFDEECNKMAGVCMRGVESACDEAGLNGKCFVASNRCGFEYLDLDDIERYGPNLWNCKGGSALCFPLLNSCVEELNRCMNAYRVCFPKDTIDAPPRVLAPPVCRLQMGAWREDNEEVVARRSHLKEFEGQLYSYDARGDLIIYERLRQCNGCVDVGSDCSGAVLEQTETVMELTLIDTEPLQKCSIGRHPTADSSKSYCQTGTWSLVNAPHEQLYVRIQSNQYCKMTVKMSSPDMDKCVMQWHEIGSLDARGNAADSGDSKLSVSYTTGTIVTTANTSTEGENKGNSDASSQANSQGTSNSESSSFKLGGSQTISQKLTLGVPNVMSSETGFQVQFNQEKVVKKAVEFSKSESFMKQVANTKSETISVEITAKPGFFKHLDQLQIKCDGLEWHSAVKFRSWTGEDRAHMDNIDLDPFKSSGNAVPFMLWLVAFVAM
uniref:Uncharacterized protein n=1 Tax=Ditylenchus dipsaci TaxID=166011 RepID=A0A915DAC4_9BILA